MFCLEPGGPYLQTFTNVTS